MKIRKIMVLNIFMILSIFVFSSCSLFEPNESDKNYEGGDYLEDYNIVDGNIILDESK